MKMRKKAWNNRALSLCFWILYMGLWDMWDMGFKFVGYAADLKYI